MPELIDKAKVLEHLTPRIKTETLYGEVYNMALEDAADLVAFMPTIEAEPVRHGRWIPAKDVKKWVTSDKLVLCSECEELNSKRSPFCPNCGARMDATDTNVGGKGGDDK